MIGPITSLRLESPSMKNWFSAAVQYKHYIFVIIIIVQIVESIVDSIQWSSRTSMDIVIGTLKVQWKLSNVSLSQWNLSIMTLFCTEMTSL